MTISDAERIYQQIPHASTLSDAVRAAGVAAWVVGGCVRDLLLDRPVLDVDIATYTPHALITALAARLAVTPVVLDEAFGFTRLVLPDGTHFDICRLRDTDIDGDLRGRDFTINALALRIPDAEHPARWHDPLHGYDDLRAGVVRMAATHTFRDDPLRILRAYRFVAELGARITPETEQALQQLLDQLPCVAAERIRSEWWKLCAGPFAEQAIIDMDASGVLDALFPEMTATRGVMQYGYHRFDVHGHLLAAARFAVEYLRAPATVFADLHDEFAPLFDDPHRRARLVTLALLHDIGKPATRSVGADERVHFYEHDVVGEPMVRAIAERLRCSREDTRAFTTVVRNHMRPLLLMHAHQRHPLSPGAQRKFFDAVGPYALEVMALAMVDKAAGQGPRAEADLLPKLRALYRDLFAFYHERYQLAQQQPLLTGDDLTTVLGMTPGPRVGEVLRQARERQMAGELCTHDEALRWAQGFVNE